MASDVVVSIFPGLSTDKPPGKGLRKFTGGIETTTAGEQSHERGKRWTRCLY
jgi:hypothetical protein